jgi:hypothetical protein
VFRADTYSPPQSAALRDEFDFASASVQSPLSAAERSEDKDAGDAMNALVRQFKQAGGGRVLPGVFPVDVPFPSFGEVLFLATELTPEGQSPSLQLEYHRERGN